MTGAPDPKQSSGDVAGCKRRSHNSSPTQGAGSKHSRLLARLLQTLRRKVVGAPGATRVGQVTPRPEAAQPVRFRMPTTLHRFAEIVVDVRGRGGCSWRRRLMDEGIRQSPHAIRSAPDHDDCSRSPARSYGGRMNQIIRELKRQSAGDKLAPEQLKALILTDKGRDALAQLRVQPSESGF
jgi:hypothetical protein